MPFEPLIGLADLDSAALKIEIRRRQRQQFSFADACPVEHLKGVVGNRLVHHLLSKFLIFFFRPEQHLPPFLCPHVSGFRCRIGVEIVKPDSVVENGAELIVQRLEIGLRIGLAFLISISEQLVLPCNHIFCGDLVDFPLAEIREQFCFDDILLGLPCAFFQPRLEIVGVDFTCLLYTSDAADEH